MKPANNRDKAYLYLHLAVILWGVTAILGKLIELREFMLVWYRMIFTSIALAMLPGVLKALLQISRKDLLIFSGIGALVALHWVCFYGSIKYANASVALCALATTTALTAVIEPLLTKRPFRLYELLLGIAVIPGILLVSHAIPDNFYLGAVMGLLAALLAAVFVSLNKKYTTGTDAGLVTFVELGAGFIFLSALLPLYVGVFDFPFSLPGRADLVWLIILSLFCTALPYMLWLKALRDVTAFSANMVNNLEPVYGIVLAALIFGEAKELEPSFYLGTFLILLTVFIQPLISRFRKDQKS